MKTTKISTILIQRSELLHRVALVLGLMVLPASVASGAQYLTVNGQDVDSITLELGQSRIVEVVSTDSTSYVAYVGFDNGVVLGDFSYLETKDEAGNLANVLDYNVPAFYGYYVSATGTAPAPSAGVHFVFKHVVRELGTTYVKLYNSTFTSEIDSVQITVIPLQPVAMGTAFTYAGHLFDANVPADGLFDFRFKVYDNANPVFALQHGPTIDINDLDVIDGYFTVLLDFGSGIFEGDARWLQIGVRPGASTGIFHKLRPRTELTPTPYAIYAEEANGLTLPYSGTASRSDTVFSVTNTDTGYAGSFEQTGSVNDNGGLNVTTAAGKYGVRIHNQGGGEENFYLYGLSAEITGDYKMSCGGRFKADVSNGYAEGILIDADNKGVGNCRGLRIYSDSTTNEVYGIDSDVDAGSESMSDLWGIKSRGSHAGASGRSYGMFSKVYGSDTGDSYGIYSEGNKRNSDTDGTAYGGYFTGDNDRTGGESYGLYTTATGTNGKRYGLYSEVTTSSNNSNYGLRTEVANDDGSSYGLYVDLDPGGAGYGVNVDLDTTAANTSNQFGLSSNVNHQGTTGSVYGVESITYSSDSGINYAGSFVAFSNTGDTGDLYGIYAQCDDDTSGNKYAGYFHKSGGGNYAGYFYGNVHVQGTLSKSSGSFKIDHPLDPENKYLSHSFVESPDMMNVYNGNAVLDKNGEACVQLPDYFEALNRDFRYQLTCIGGFAPVYVSEEISDNRFKIAGGKRGMKVSWQVTGVRHDPYAVAHRVQVEEEKNNEERGYYLNPMAYGEPEEKGIESVRNQRVSENRQVAKNEIR